MSAVQSKLTKIMQYELKNGVEVGNANSENEDYTFVFPNQELCTTMKHSQSDFCPAYSNQVKAN